MRKDFPSFVGSLCWGFFVFVVSIPLVPLRNQSVFDWVNDKTYHWIAAIAGPSGFVEVLADFGVGATFFFWVSFVGSRHSCGGGLLLEIKLSGKRRMTDGERRILRALAGMCEQYISRDGELDHMSMTAGERAVAVLTDYGLVTPVSRGGRWTEAGQALLSSRDSS